MASRGCCRGSSDWNTGIFTGSSYALIAAGLVLILGVVKVINLSHGAFFTLGAYTTFVFSSRGIGVITSYSIHYTKLYEPVTVTIPLPSTWK